MFRYQQLHMPNSLWIDSVLGFALFLGGSLNEIGGSLNENVTCWEYTHEGYFLSWQNV